MADTGVTYNSSMTYQHAVAHNPDVRSQPGPMHGTARQGVAIITLLELVVSLSDVIHFPRNQQNAIALPDVCDHSRKESWEYNLLCLAHGIAHST